MLLQFPHTARHVVMRSRLPSIAASFRAFHSASAPTAVMETMARHAGPLQLLVQPGVARSEQGGSGLPAEVAWRQWQAAAGNDPAMQLAAQATQGNVEASVFLAFALWLRDGVPAVHRQAARWAAGDLTHSVASHARGTSGSEAETVLHTLQHIMRIDGSLSAAQAAESVLQRGQACVAGGTPPGLSSSATTLLCASLVCTEPTLQSEFVAAAHATGLPQAAQLSAAQVRQAWMARGATVETYRAAMKVKWVRQLLKADWYPAHVQLGRGLLSLARSMPSHEGSKTADRALSLLRGAAQRCSVDAAAELGAVLAHGAPGRPRDGTLALAYLRQAARAGHVRAMVELGRLLQQLGMPRRESEAWWVGAALAGSGAARRLLLEQPISCSKEDVEACGGDAKALEAWLAQADRVAARPNAE